MTHKYERECWSCGNKDMEDKGSYGQCHFCGATWNETPPLAPEGLEPGTVTITTKAGAIKVRARHPSPAAQRQAARARAKASPNQRPKE